MITFVHALWGDINIANWPKVLRDIQVGMIWTKLPPKYNRMVFSYGKHNWRFLRRYGVQSHLLSTKSFVDFLGIGSNVADGRGMLGNHNYGISHWEHKQRAIVEAFNTGAKQVIWLDWDTRVTATCWDMLETLQDGQEFQGRMRRYNNSRVNAWYRYVYHGGCYYMRTPDVMVEASRLRPQARYVTDEVLVTIATNNLYFDSYEATPQQHRDAGIDSPVLYSTRHNAIASGSRPLFFEGKAQHIPAFVAGEKVPNDEEIVLCRNRK